VAGDTAALADFLADLRPGADVARILVGPPACPRADLTLALPLVRDGQQTALQGRPWAYSDSGPLTAGLPFRSDGVHPTAATYRTWADRLVAAWQAAGRGEPTQDLAELADPPEAARLARVPWPLAVGVAGLLGLGALGRYLGRGGR
jgi:hypothetical protein